MVAGVANMTRPFGKRKGNISVDFDRSISPIEKKYVDSEALKQVLYNIIFNAIKYSQPNGVVSIYRGPKIRGFEDCICVENKGFGINEDDENRIWELGFRGDNARRMDAGHGKGLFIARRIMRAFEGDVILIRGKSPTIFGICFRH
jgi:signal transduction histidine kinase